MSAFVDLRLEVVPGAGHMLHHDAPVAVAELIETFNGAGPRGSWQQPPPASGQGQ